ncbi:SH3 domain-containing protein [Aestuariivirga litoralis]|uniref:SH3 domain-containing protein n=1 Tax=Aestuariivirga litoralis TaxID=2650924 RepID=UPI0018C753FC|nr:SH3 domain-containing protein [Aestuariivirga litoralis]MBG1231095.1 SH3 domain-containing protein [Aestuariivirga litoralis]
MKLRTTIITAISAIALGGLTMATAAQAYPARSESAVNVRSGPGTQYDVVGQLDPGERVNVTGSNGGWSRIGGGWVSSNYLTASNAYAPRVYDTPSYYDDSYAGPPVYFGLNFGGGNNWHNGHRFRHFRHH